MKNKKDQRRWTSGKDAVKREWPRGRANAPRDLPGHALRNTRRRF